MLFVNIAVASILIVGALLSVFRTGSYDYWLFKWWASYAPQITLAYWVLGLIFFFIKQVRLTFVSFACCGFMCLYLKTTTNPALVAPRRTNEPILKLASFNISSSNSGYAATISSIKKTDADIIVLEDMAFEWFNLIEDSLKKDYPHSCESVGADLLMLKIYSKFPIQHCEKFYIANEPTLAVSISSKYVGGNVVVMAANMIPPLFERAYQDMQLQLDSLSKRILNYKTPVIIASDFNIESSANEIQKFRRASKLSDSRRGYRPDYQDGYISIFQVPTEHVFYTAHFSCIEFKTIGGIQHERLGNVGIYQFNADSLLYNR